MKPRQPDGASRARARSIETGAGWTMVHGEAYAWLLEQPDDAFDALIADAPYSSGGFTRGDRSSDPSTKYAAHGAASTSPSFAGDNRDQRAYLRWCTLWLSEAHRVLRDGAPVCLWSDWRQLPTTTDAMQLGGFVWRGIAVWGKNNASRPQMGRFRADTEFLVWGSKGAMPARPDVGALPGAWTCAPVSHTARLHLTEIAPPGGVVVDLFAGSASTGVACLRRGRRFVGVEHSKTYFDRSVVRMRAEERAIGAQGALFEAAS